MKLSDLIAQVRSQTDDVATSPQLWSDSDITLYLNEALREACIRAKLIHDEVTDKDANNNPVTLIQLATTAVTPQTPTGVQFKYDLHPSIFQIDTAVYVDTQLPLLEVPKDMYLRDRWHYRYGYGYATPGVFGDYNTASQGRATGYWPNINPDGSMEMRLLPLPSATTYVDVNGDTQPIQIRLCVYRTQLVDLDSSSPQGLAASPEIHPRWHMKLIDGACARMFVRRDRDTYDPVKANQFEQAFTASFGPAVPANVLRQRQEYRRQRTRFRFPH